MQKIFLDCGLFDGVAIKQYCVDDSWEIHTFEPNPKKLTHLPPMTLHKEAVWIEDGVVDFSYDPYIQASHIVGVAGKEYKKVKKVPCIDFSRFVEQLPPADLIVCSMDIEGAEFEVLRKMIKDYTIRRIKVLDVEFHQRIMSTEDDETARTLIQELSDLGVIVRLKIVLDK